MSRKSRGRQKLALVKIPNESNLMVTFSKRRTGLFKKASELSTLCGAEVAIIVFSPGRKAFSFGHPCVEKVLDRFANGSLPQNSGAFQLIEAHRNARVRDLNTQLTQVLDQLEMEKKQGEELDRMRKLSQRQYWWENPIEDLDLAQLEQLKSSLQGLRQNVAKQVEQVLIRNSNPPQQLITGNSSGNVIVPYDGRINSRLINTSMPIATPPPVNINMTMATFNPNMNMAPPINSNMNMNYAYNLGYGNGFF